MIKDADETYRNAIASAAHTAVEDSWTEVRKAVTAWKNDASTPTAWATYLDALYGYAETNRNACSEAYVDEVEATAAAQKTLDIATAAAYRYYLTDSAATVNTAEKRAADKLKKLYDAAVVTTTNAAKGIKLLQCDEYTTQIELLLTTQLGRIDEYMVVAAPLLLDYYAQLSGASSGSGSSGQPEWLAYSYSLLDERVSLYSQLLVSAEKIEKGTAQRDADKDKALWDLIGAYQKDVVDVNADRDSDSQDDLDVYEAAFDLAQHTYLVATLAADGVYETAVNAADAAQTSAENTLTQTTVQNQYDSYFTALTSACSGMSKRIK